MLRLIVGRKWSIHTKAIVWLSSQIATPVKNDSRKTEGNIFTRLLCRKLRWKWIFWRLADLFYSKNLYSYCMSQIHTLCKYFIIHQLKTGHHILLMDQLSKYSVIVFWEAKKEPAHKRNSYFSYLNKSFVSGCFMGCMELQSCLHLILRYMRSVCYVKMGILT